MTTAETNFWGTLDSLRDFLDSVRRPGEEPSGYDSRFSFDDAVAYAKVIGEAGETLLAELMKMKAQSLQTS